METGLEGPHGPEVVLSDYVIDYTRLNIDQRVLMEHEVDGYDFRYVYGLDLVNVKVTGEGSDWWGQNIKQCIFSDYVHTDRLGSVVNLSDQYGRVPARIDYDAWGSVTAYDSITVDGGFRILLPEITYAGHQYDDILNQYYAKARMYDADNRRFTAVDPVKGNITDPLSLVQYIYVVNRPLVFIDPLGEMSPGILNMIKDAYISGALTEDMVFTVVTIFNVVEIATRTLRAQGKDRILNSLGTTGQGLKLIGLIDAALHRDAESDLIEDKNYEPGIFLSFHETAQVLAAKQIMLSPSMAGLELAGIPELESRLTIGKKEIDIAWGNFIWEVKPGYHTTSSWISSLKKYINKLQYDYSTGTMTYKPNKTLPYLPGLSFPQITAMLFGTDDTRMDITVKYMGMGQIGYFLSLRCNGQEEAVEVEAKEAAAYYQELYKLAEDIDAATPLFELGAALLGILALDGVPGDEAAAASSAISALQGLSGVSQEALNMLNTLITQLEPLLG